MSNKSKPTVMTVYELEALLSAVYTQITELKADLKVKNGQMAIEVKQELKTLRSAEKKVRQMLRMK